MILGPRRRPVFWAALALTGLCAGVFLLGVHAEKPKSEPQTLARSSILPVLAAGQTLKTKVVEARGIAITLDQETLAAKSKLPAVKGVFEPIHSGLASKPAKPDQYGGGMSSRLEFIEKNLTIAQEALSRRDSTEWRRGRVRPPFKSDADKCNQFVAEVANWWKAKVPNMHGVRNPGPPLARDWANSDPKFKIPGWIVVTDPMPGDIIATQEHVGIIVGKKLTASAAAPKYGDKINVNDWGFGKDDHPTFRRYIGEAQ